MSATIPILKREPQTIAAGDNVSWYRQLDDYPATAWTLKYVLRNSKQIYKFDAAASAASSVLYQVTLATSTTTGWVAGVYAMDAYVVSADTLSQVQVQTYFPTITITPNLAVNPSGGDPRTFASRMLELCEATIAKLTSKTVTMAQVNGQSYSLQNIGDLWKMRERFASEVRREEAAVKLNAGLGGSNKVTVRFRTINPQGWPPRQMVPWQ